MDELLYLSNVHSCVTRNKSSEVSQGAQKTRITEVDNRGCTNPETGHCKARFPRETHASTFVDPESGALIMKKGEAWLNTFTPAVSYLLCCNHDVTVTIIYHVSFFLIVVLYLLMFSLVYLHVRIHTALRSLLRTTPQC